MNYEEFLHRKTQLDSDSGFEPLWIPDFLFPFQRHLVEWAIRRGRAAVLADCGLGKTPMQLVWAENVWRKTRKPVLLLTPLAVGAQTVREGEKFNIECKQSRDGKIAAQITITNYEKLHLFNPEDYSACICDESSILKHFSGATQKDVTRFMCKMLYRSLWTATAAPNDYIELGTSSEALGNLERKHMLAQFFTHDGGDTSSWMLKGHAKSHMFWRWVCSWARAICKPSDIGYDDGPFILPELRVRQHIVNGGKPRDGYLFDIAAVGLSEQRQDLRKTIDARVDMAAQVVNAHNRPAVAWCNLNQEGIALARSIRGAVEVAGHHSDEYKEQTFDAFVRGDIRVLVTKPTIGGFGLNLQHCAHQTFFPSHSYEQYYQCIRRCWRFGQRNPVVVDMITTPGQNNVLLNLQRKTAQSAVMFSNLVATLSNEMRIVKSNEYKQKEEIPSWL